MSYGREQGFPYFRILQSLPAGTIGGVVVSFFMGNGNVPVASLAAFATWAVPVCILFDTVDGMVIDRITEYDRLAHLESEKRARSDVSPRSGYRPFPGGGGGPSAYRHFM